MLRSLMILAAAMTWLSVPPTKWVHAQGNNNLQPGSKKLLMGPKGDENLTASGVPVKSGVGGSSATGAGAAGELSQDQSAHSKSRSGVPPMLSPVPH